MSLIAGRFAGRAGVWAGIALVGETACFLASGWAVEKMNDPAAAMALLAHGGQFLRLSAVFGSAGIALTALFVIGLYLRLRERSPRAAIAVLVWGLVGLAPHALIPLGLWLTIPEFVQWAARDVTAAGNAWMAFWNVCNSAQGVGSLFDGLAMLTTGVALVREPDVRPFATVAIVAGAASVFTVAAVGTPVQGLAALVYLPMIALTVVFRSWGGVLVERHAVNPPLERTINA
jgi:hypothetical protein